MQDATSTTFGLGIAYLLPGAVGLYSLIYWFPGVRTVFTTFLGANSNVGLFLLVIVAALVVGLIVNAFRCLLLEAWLLRGHRPSRDDFARLGLTDTRAVRDEHFRYHQFYGGMLFSSLFLYAGYLKDRWSTLSRGEIVASLLVFLVVEGATGYVAVDAYKRFVSRTKHLMEAKDV